MSVFQRNLTSILLEKAIKDYLRTVDHSIDMLEIGCGDGNITREISLEFTHNCYYASDISEEAIERAKALCDKNISSNISFKVSQGFNGWAQNKFDVILCDVSAINQRIAELSDWYVGVKCDTGDDGLGAIRPIIQNANTHLNSGGVFILPTISLSNTLELEKLLKKYFRSVAMVQSKDWPMPEDLSLAIINQNVPNKGVDWNTKNKFGIEIANTGVLLCKI